jgi:hypothetical protein
MAIENRGPTENRIVAASQAMRVSIVDLAGAVLKIDGCAGYVLHGDGYTVTIERKRADMQERPDAV